MSPTRPSHPQTPVAPPVVPMRTDEPTQPRPAPTRHRELLSPPSASTTAPAAPRPHRRPRLRRGRALVAEPGRRAGRHARDQRRCRSRDSISRRPTRAPCTAASAEWPGVHAGLVAAGLPTAHPNRHAADGCPAAEPDRVAGLGGLRPRVAVARVPESLQHRGARSPVPRGGLPPAADDLAAASAVGSGCWPVR